MEKNLYKNRSISACIKSSFDTLIMNFTTIFKKTWIGNLVWTISTTFILLIFAQLGRMLIKNEPLSLLIMLLLLCAFILYCVTSIYMSSKNILFHILFDSYRILFTESSKFSTCDSCCYSNI